MPKATQSLFGAFVVVCVSTVGCGLESFRGTRDRIDHCRPHLEPVVPGLVFERRHPRQRERPRRGRGRQDRRALRLRRRRARPLERRRVRVVAPRHRGHRRRGRRRRRPQRHLSGDHQDGAPSAPQPAPRCRRPAVVQAVGHGSDPRPAGPRDLERKQVGARRPARLGRRRHPPRPGRPGQRRRQRLLLGRHPRHLPGDLGERRHRPRDVHLRDDRRPEERHRHGGRRPGRSPGHGQGGDRRLQRPELRAGLPRRVRLRYRLGDRAQLRPPERQPHHRPVHRPHRRHLLQRPARPGRHRADRPQGDPQGRRQEAHRRGRGRKLLHRPREPEGDHPRQQLQGVAGPAAPRSSGSAPSAPRRRCRGSRTTASARST